MGDNGGLHVNDNLLALKNINLLCWYNGQQFIYMFKVFLAVHFKLT